MYEKYIVLICFNTFDMILIGLGDRRRLAKVLCESQKTLASQTHITSIKMYEGYIFPIYVYTFYMILISLGDRRVWERAL